MKAEHTNIHWKKNNIALNSQTCVGIDLAGEAFPIVANFWAAGGVSTVVPATAGMVAMVVLSLSVGIEGAIQQLQSYIEIVTNHKDQQFRINTIQ